MVSSDVFSNANANSDYGADADAGKVSSLEIGSPPEICSLGEDRILVVDDAPTNLFILSRLLEAAGYRVDEAQNGLEAISLATLHRPSVILLDIIMPNMNGYEVCTQLRSQPNTAHIPVIFISSLDAPFDKVQAFQNGAADYVTKPFQPEEVLARVRHQTELQRARKQQQQINIELESRVKERTQLLEIAHNQLLKVAMTDRLTHLPNRLSFIKRLSRVMAQVQIDPARTFAVLFFDFDRFKRINDSLGHRIGDQLLKGVAHRLVRMKPNYAAVDMIARFGGDEFALLLTEVDRRSVVVGIAKDVLQIISQPFALAEHDIFVNASIGMVWGDSGYVAAEHLLRDADMAMYQAKVCTQRPYRWFESDMHSDAVQLLELETDFRLALDRREFELHYQPIVDLKRMKLVSFEALVRWRHPVKGLVFPNDFISFAEENGFITELGNQVLEMACQHLADWERLGDLDPELSVSVNIASEQLLQPDILAQMEIIIAKTGACAHRLRLELTERSIISNRVLADEVLQAFRRRHIQVSIDDFGTGYSALNYLHTLPVSCLKIDRSFVQRITHEASSLGIVPLIINMAETMHMDVIAEGIENETQLRQLQKLGCKHGQGYFFQKAVSFEKAHALLSHPFFPDWAESFSA